MCTNNFLNKFLNTAPQLNEMRNIINAYRNRISTKIEPDYWDILSKLKKDAVCAGNDNLSKTCWCFETIGHAQDFFVEAFNKAKEDDFYSCWCLLEKCEIALHALAKHLHLDDNYGLVHMETHTRRFQDLFPYRYFFSPGFIIREAKCSICNQPIKLRTSCGHDIGEIYNGEMCGRVITKVDVLEVSIVDNPVQKYSVLFGPEITYDYGRIKYVISGLRSPWHKWSYKTTEICEKFYPETEHNAPCPCGSGKKYKKCCITKTKKRTHYQIYFNIPPPKELPLYVPEYKYEVKGSPNDNNIIANEES